MTDIIANIGLKSQYKKVFVAAILCGIFSQGMGIFNKYSVHDDVACTFSVGATYTSGRWMLDIMSKVEKWIFGDGLYSLPVINGSISIICIALAACFIIKMVGIGNELIDICVVGLMVSCPVVTSMFSFMFTAHFYMLGMLLGVIGTFLVCECDKRWINGIGILCISMSIGVYQAFLSCILSLMLLYLIKELMDRDTINISMFAKKRIFLLGGAITSGLAIYFGVTKIYLLIMRAQLNSYKGISSFGITSLKGYLIRIINAYIEFFAPSKNTQYNIYPGNVRTVYIIMIICCILADIVWCYKKRKNSHVRIMIYVVLIALLPLSYNFVYLMVDKEEIHSLMLYGQVFPFIRFAQIIDRMNFNCKRLARMKVVGGYAVFILGIISYSRYDNKCYLKATYIQQETISYFTTLVTQIKNVSGYTDEMPVVYINAGNITDKSIYEMEELNNIEISYYGGIKAYINDYVWDRFMARWCGYSPTRADEETYKNLPEVLNMPTYPDDGSIKVVDEVIVVKF